MAKSKTKHVLAMATVISIAFFWASSALAYKPVVFYSDLVNGPKIGGKDNKGAFVTIWGKHFGETRGTSHVSVGGGMVDNYPLWSDEKISFQLGADASSGNIVVSTQNGISDDNIPFQINSGRIFFTTSDDVESGEGTYTNPWKNAKQFMDNLQPADILYLRQGVYTGQYGATFMGANCQLMTATPGTADANIAWVAYPGESVTFRWGNGRHFLFRSRSDTSKSAHYNVVSQIIMDGDGGSTAGGLDTGGYYLNEEQGAHHLRIVGSRVTNCAKGNSTTMTGHLRFTNDGSKVLGVEIDNCGIKGNPLNNNHLIYVQCGADDIEIAYSHFHDNAAGHCIQLHADHAPYTYSNVLIHHNKISNDNPGDMRGPTVSNVLSDTEVYFYNNLLINIGAFSGFNLVNGKAYLSYNTFYNMGGSGAVSLMSSNGQYMYLKYNILWSNGNAPYVHFGSYGSDNPGWSNVTVVRNCYFNNGNGPSQDLLAINKNPEFSDPGNNFHLKSTSPCINKGQ